MILIRLSVCLLVVCVFCQRFRLALPRHARTILLPGQPVSTELQTAIVKPPSIRLYVVCIRSSRRSNIIFFLSFIPDDEGVKRVEKGKKKEVYPDEKKKCKKQSSFALFCAYSFFFNGLNTKRLALIRSAPLAKLTTQAAGLLDITKLHFVLSPHFKIMLIFVSLPS